MKKLMSTTSLFDILSEVRGTKLTKVAQIDRVIDWAPVRAVIETVYTKGSAPTAARATMDSCFSRLSCCAFGTA